MESSGPCKRCGKRSFSRDDISSYLICSSCGSVQEFDSYEAHIGGITGDKGTSIRFGTVGVGTVLDYKEKKIYEAQNLIDDLMYRLGLSGSKPNDVKTMIHEITEGEFGQGNWFPILIGACAYVIMRKDNKSIPMAEVASAVQTDVHELGRMVMRVINYLKLELPEFDIVNSFERTVRNSRLLQMVSKDKIQLIVRQGVFLIQTAIKWCLTTGRRPLPFVAAVLVFVGELNEVDIRIEDVANEIHAVVSTCRLRYKELLKTLVEAAQILPWGKDITTKNIVKNAPFLIQYMEMKSMVKPKEVSSDVEQCCLSLEDVISECLSKDVASGTTNININKNEALYLEDENKDIPALSGNSDLESIKISHECLSLLYPNFLKEVNYIRSMEESGKGNRVILERGFELSACTDWWTGKSDLSKKLFLKDILVKDVGLDFMPPSFIRNGLANRRRREKINAAKKRINKIMHPWSTEACKDGQLNLPVQSGKKRKNRELNQVDWEDFIIEMLLLHQVKEEEIEKGHYNTLLDLHVFDSNVKSFGT